MTPLGMDGIAPDGTRILLCGVSYRQVISCAGMSQKDAAKRLGVNHAHFNEVINRIGASHWFTFTRPRKLTREDIVQVASEGYTQQDAAFVLDVGYSCLREAVKLYGLRHLFPSNGRAQAISRKGYCQ